MPSDPAAPGVTALLAGVLDRVSAGPTSAQATGDKISLQTLIAALEERAFGLGILILALPCCVPFLYGIPQIVALPMLALAAQLAAGRHEPWLPKSLAERQVSISALRGVVERTQKYLGFVERLATPRLTFLSQGPGARIIGAVMLIPTASILVPLPSTNTVPGIGVAVASVGLLERDGILILLGLLLGLAWVFALVFVGAEALSALKTMVFGT